MKFASILIVVLFSVASICKKYRRETTKTTKSSLKAVISSKQRQSDNNSLIYILSDGLHSITGSDPTYEVLSNPPLIAKTTSPNPTYDLSTIKEKCFDIFKKYIHDNVKENEFEVECIGSIYILSKLFNIPEIEEKIRELYIKEPQNPMTIDETKELILNNKYLQATTAFNTARVLEYSKLLKSLENKLHNLEDQDNERRLNYYSKGIHEDLLIKDLLNAGFITVYNYSYGHKTTHTELLKIKYDIGKNSSIPICVGAKEKNKEELALAACGVLDEVLTLTRLQYKARYSRGVYWYFLEGKSFGFAPSENITMKYGTDVEEDNEELRLSWKIDGKNGGWRVGEEDGIYTNAWNKMIFVRKPDGE